MAVYKLLRGQHAQGKGADRKVFKRGAMVESDTDLEGRFGSQKFRKMGESTPKASKAESKEEVAAAVEDDLESMSVIQLKELAENEEIDITGLKVKADIIERIRESR